ncbi:MULTISPECIES: type II toxin-antitoxin system PrlF family antitoxin [Brenneria]|uniref:AbrB family transcriptional regulator n=2 Tax=Brenneria TaxID=71655 RepID=A0A2U1UDE9_9GAMM|nr:MULTISPECIES: type II toxin-antitoxin system PrlF family antitoxin [Brenneria]MCL2893554.1 type II toxin-antitoxin system PrlF family antitoxin [Brenneria tiliae]MCL2899296.1 type II toxin-antitoxin system PrlF family antitoxin [Brenneria tiliae]MCL2903674.1 type II toxin-antitoxin system PrlF family antitoxin [Brenneria tiliae]PWC19701.1 AbrB family transcriptional regulator [Brenneria sp. CFCC 11842]
MAALTELKPVDICESKITERGQTTIPATILRTLNLKKGVDRIQYRVLPNGDVLIPRKNDDEADPVIGRFLEFLARDIAANPATSLQPLSAELVDRIGGLVAGVEWGDLDSPLSDDED